VSRGLPIVDDGQRLDADALTKRLELLRRSTHGAEGLSVELYHRAALTLRVGTGRDGKSVTTQRGEDEGLAMRAATREGNELAFAASTGSELPSFRWVLERGRSSESSVPPQAGWPTDRTEPLLDREGETGLPSVDELSGWLSRAREVLETGPGRPQHLESWIEVAHTVESWVADGGLRASRTRTRGWALYRTREPWAGDRASKRVLVAHRRWSELPPDAWRSVLEDRRLPERAPEAPPTRKVPVLFNPECSALLVQALVRSLHSDESGRGAEVGAAWNVTDDPAGDGALFGGTFDDAGFPTRRTLLSDGRRWCGAIEGRGNYRRPSFRDRPVALPSQLVVSSGVTRPPDSCVLATALGLHVTEPDRWVLRIDGALLTDGHPGPVLRPCFASVSPVELIRRCMAAVGPARPSYLGVETPGLVFDDLLLQ
jgi:hypothetical protein